jgi:hypothetical protein
LIVRGNRLKKRFKHRRGNCSQPIEITDVAATRRKIGSLHGWFSDLTHCSARPIADAGASTTIDDVAIADRRTGPGIGGTCVSELSAFSKSQLAAGHRNHDGGRSSLRARIT